MPDTPNQQPSDDTEGHRNMDTEATSEDDVEGYKYRSNMDTEATSEDDAEGHALKRYDAKATSEEDVEGHAYGRSPKFHDDRTGALGADENNV